SRWDHSTRHSTKHGEGRSEGHVEGTSVRHSGRRGQGLSQWGGVGGEGAAGFDTWEGSSLSSTKCHRGTSTCHPHPGARPQGATGNDAGSVGSGSKRRRPEGIGSPGSGIQYDGNAADDEGEEGREGDTPPGKHRQGAQMSRVAPGHQGAHKGSKAGAGKGRVSVKGPGKKKRRPLTKPGHTPEGTEPHAGAGAQAGAGAGTTAGPRARKGEVAVTPGQSNLWRKSRRRFEVVVSESEGEEPATAYRSWVELQEAARVEARLLLSGGRREGSFLEAEAEENRHWVRRSVRAAGAAALESPQVQQLLEQIRSNHPDMEVLKLHHYLGPDANTATLDAVLEALEVNENCQALYIQNFNEGFRDAQVRKLSSVLARGTVWCLNAGENYKVALESWWGFVSSIKDTNLTHAYLSEHVITPELKTALRASIRANRTKHDRHRSLRNLGVIRQCTNMWWNPINSKALQAEMTAAGITQPCPKRGGGDGSSDVTGGSGGSGEPPATEDYPPCSLHVEKGNASQESFAG
ncbi:unnamed protein product, partial [Discosporangium mesarthrocarpum]